MIKEITKVNKTMKEKKRRLGCWEKGRKEMQLMEDKSKDVLEEQLL